MPDITTTTVGSTSHTTVTQAKPGYKTTEFWLKVVALLLTILYASDAIPVGGEIDKLMAIGATVLGALGYTVSRTMVKRAGAAAIGNLPGSLIGQPIASQVESSVALVDDVPKAP